MRKRLLVILRRAARRLLLRRVLESCAVTATAGALCGAVVELGWWLSAVSVAAGSAVCALAAFLGVWLWLRPGPRRITHLDVLQAAVVGGLMVVGGTAGVAGLWLGWADATAPWGAPLVLVSIGVLAGAVLAVVRGVSALQAAVYLDIHGEFDERLATAVEAEANQAGGTLADGLYAQALDALSGVPYRKVFAWKRTRATLGALALATALAALCGAMGSMAPLKTPSAVDEIGSLADLPGALKEMGPGKLRVVVVAIETLAGAEGIPEKMVEALRTSARAAESRDDERLGELLAGLDKATRQRLEDAIQAAVKRSAGGGPGADGGRSPVAANNNAGGNGGNGGKNGNGAPLGGTGVRVYHPKYADTMRKNGHTADGNGGMAPRGYVWRLSRARAVHALNAGQVPIEYRPIIIKFFGTEP